MKEVTIVTTKKKVNPLNILHEKKKNLEKTRSTMFMIEELSKQYTNNPKQRGKLSIINRDLASLQGFQTLKP